ncbi:MAG: 16S rRNA (uracil(1498)-N(3))-methyltransferase [Verrucomicrobia bacterium]|nr:MAG: 16S rRNA (uracil(1498)-N(3))-methyltransferase [Verrucomicrobiota bacterium]
MPRFFLPPAAWSASGAPSILTGEEAPHLAQVLRIQPGTHVTVFDGEGRRAQARVLEVSRSRVALELSEVPPCGQLLPVITLAQAIPKGKTMDLIVQKAVELGVATIQPLVTRHTIVHPGAGKSEKWRRTALEACKQCGQDRLPDIPDALAFDRWLATQTPVAALPNTIDSGDAGTRQEEAAGRMPAPRGPGILPAASVQTTKSIEPTVLAAPPSSLKLIASLAPAARPLRDVLQAYPATTHATLLIGPEGDFSPDETAAAIVAGFLPVSLGSIVLRVETASLYCLSVLRYQFGRD